MSEPKLAPPGAGLPALEAVVVRRLVFPALQWKLNQERAVALFEQSGQAILSLVEGMDHDRFTKPVLIKRLPGLEDSSRNWSAEMTLEHVQIVTAAALFIIKKLEAQQEIELPVRTQDVKPNGGLGLDRIRAFRTNMVETPGKVASYEFTSPVTHFHPWFGELKSLDWLRLIAFHQDLHRKQIERIVAGLG